MIGREKELQFIKDGFSKFGHLRCAITLGPEGIGKSTFLEKAQNVHSLKEGKSISITPDSRHCSDLLSLLSSMARNISCGSEITGNEISKFARFYGSQLVQF
jgi:ABC-type enterochelin transport system ATPase subunit